MPSSLRHFLWIIILVACVAFIPRLITKDNEPVTPDQILTHNLEELYQSIYDSLNKLMPLPNFFIAIYDNKNETINFEYFIFN